MLEEQPHYVVISVGTTGDLHPFLRFAKALQSTGRKVTFITNTIHTKLLDGSGLTVVGLGTEEEYIRQSQDPNLWHPTKGFAAAFAHYKDQMLEVDTAIRSVANTSPIVVITHVFVLPAAVMAREQGSISKIVATYLAPGPIGTCHDPMRLGAKTMPRWVPMSWRRALLRFIERKLTDPIALPKLNAARSARNLPAVPAPFSAHMKNEPDLTVTLFPPWFGPAMPDWPQPLLSGDFQLLDPEPADCFSKELATFLAAGSKPLVFTPGTGHLPVSEFFSYALAAVASLGERAIFLTNERALLPANLPTTILWQPYVPLSGLLPHCKAVIHHGGVGTTAEALRAGTPQLVTPFAWDQFDNAARVAELGAGLVLLSKELSPQKLTRAIRAIVTSESIRSRCAHLASLFTQRQDPTALCVEIEQRVLGRRAG